VALLAAATVLLGVATYFGFSESAKNAEALAKSARDKSDVERDRGNLQNLVNDLKEKAGFPKADDASVVKAIFMVIVVDGLFAMFFASIAF